MSSLFSSHSKLSLSLIHPLLRKQYLCFIAVIYIPFQVLNNNFIFDLTEWNTEGTQHPVIQILVYNTDAWRHDDVIKWKNFPRYWPFVRGIHRGPLISPHKGQWRGALMFSLICVWINGWVNNRDAGDLRRYRAHYDVIVMDSNNVLVIKHLP